ncbi:MAG: 2Fe-2S ferredoxin, partial [Bacteroidota bacterium]|nr:2Fe-2S ferredoxin [Bacteroidota bacterium]
MKSKMPDSLPECEMEAPENSRRNFLKQSALITAVALTPAVATKAADMHVDEKIAEAFEKLPLKFEV